MIHTAAAPQEPAGRFSRVEWVGLALGLLLLALWGLQAAPLFDVDEGAFSEATREMLSSGDWLHTTLNGEPRFDKPIGIYWLQAVSVSLFGLNEFALRLPSALSAWGWSLALAMFAVPRWGRQVAVSAALMLSTSVGVMVIGRAATADALLNLLLALATLDGWRWIESARPAVLRRAFTWIGLALLVKGPVGVLVPGAAVLLWLFASLPWREALGRVRGAVSDGWAWALLLGIAVPWYAYALHRHGMAFVDGFLIRHNLARYGSALEQHNGSLGYYFVVLPLLLLPWTPLLVPVLARLKTAWQNPTQRYLLLWGGFVLGFFSLSGTKLPHYVLYGATPFVLLMAQALVQARERAQQWLRAGLTLSLLLVLAMLCGSALTLGWWGGQLKHPLYAALLAGQHAPAWLVWLTAMAAVAVLFLMTQLHRPGVTLALRSSAAAGVVALVCLGVALPWWGELVQGPVRHAGEFAAGRSESAVQWGLHQPSFAVYRRQPTPRRAPQDGELALVRLDQLPRLMQAAGGRYQVMFEERGYGLILWRASAAPSQAEVALVVR